jgi:nicotinamide mononucleotide transporter
MQSLLHYYLDLPLAELIAVALSLIYIILATKENVWCWPAAFVSTAIYTIIFYDVALLMDSFLNIYYMAMAIYGWFCWHKVNAKPATAELIKLKQRTKQEPKQTLKVKSWPYLTHVKCIVALSLLSLASGYVMATFTFAAFPYLDSATTVFAIFTTYLVAIKVLENWAYWLVIDFVSIYLYLEKGLQATALLFAFYVVIAIYGYWQWSKQYKNQNLALPAKLAVE